jgi:hypothetical protein
MGALTTTRRGRPKVGVTHDVQESAAILFAMRVAELQWTPRDVYALTFNSEPPRGWTLDPELRSRTAMELDALAALDASSPPSHDGRRQDAVLARIFKDDRLRKFEGTGHLAVHSRKTGLRIEWSPVMTSAEMLVDYGLAMLLDDSQSWGQLFFRCHLDRCRRFFIATRPKYKGQFRYKYCSPEHQREADAALVADRVKRFRQRQKEARK